MVSMKDIAGVCGVSVATVSKALSNRLDIGVETKELIKTKAREMGYFPNSQARALRTNRTYNLGILFVEKANSGLTHDYFIHVINSFKVVAEEKGYDITFVNNKFTASYLEHSRYRGFDGIVLACIDFQDPEILELVNSEIPLVTIDYVFQNRPAIISNNRDGMKELLEYIYSQGHRRIAYIYGRESEVTKIRLKSFYEVFEEKGLSIPKEYVREAAYRNMITAGQITKELLDLKNPPTCILYPDDYSAIGGINVIRERGLSIPGDISVAGYDGISVLMQMEPELTTIRQNTEMLGRRAAEKLIGLIEDPQNTKIEMITVDSGLIEGKTTAKIPVV